MSKSQQARKYLPIGALGVSLLLHLTIFLGVSGVILIQAVSPKLIPSGVATSASADEMPAPPELLDNDMPDAPELLPVEDVALPSSPSAAFEQITSPTPLMMTNMTAGPAVSLAGMSGTAPDAGGGEKAEQPAVKAKGLAKAGNPFGERRYVSGALVGRMYDFKKTADGKPTKIAGAPREEFDHAVMEFVKRWDVASLDKYYRADAPLGTPQVFIPRMSAGAAPRAFGVQGQIQPSRWMIVYQGKIMSPREIQLRFVGIGDDFLVARVDGKVVLDAGLIPAVDGKKARKELPDAKPYVDHNPAAQLYAGDWLTLEAGQVYALDVMIAESPGGLFAALLLFEERGAVYRARRDQPKAKALPVFQLAPTALPEYTVGQEGPDVAAPSEDLFFGAGK